MTDRSDRSALQIKACALRGSASRSVRRWAGHFGVFPQSDYDADRTPFGTQRASLIEMDGARQLHQLVQRPVCARVFRSCKSGYDVVALDWQIIAALLKFSHRRSKPDITGVTGLNGASLGLAGRLADRTRVERLAWHPGKRCAPMACFLLLRQQFVTADDDSHGRVHGWGNGDALQRDQTSGHHAS
jgi:hypothetical protein